MRRQQLILSIGALAFVVLLFSLPKVLLNKEEKELENAAELDKTATKADSHDAPHGKQIILSDLNKQKAAKWRSLVNQTSEYKAKLQYLDSLSALYTDNGLYDSAAYQYETALAGYSTIANWEIIGDACYKAFYFAVEEDNAAKWATKTQKYYQLALDKNPNLLDIKARLAMTYTRGQNPMQAVLTLREVLDKNPNNEQALLNIGLLSIQSGQYDKAIERFKKLLSINPENWLGTFYLGIGYAESGKKKEAKECFQKVKKNEKQAQIVEAADQYLKQLSVNP